MSDTPQAVEINCTTGETTYRDLTAEEIAERNQAAAQAAADATAKANADAAAAAAKASGEAKLAALGLTNAEIAALTA